MHYSIIKSLIPPVDNDEESTWPNSGGLELDRFTQSLLTVSVGAIGSNHSRKR